MQRVPEIKAAYDWMIAAYGREYAQALQASDQPAQDRLARQRDHLERGVFVLLFAQFEVAVTARFETVRNARKSNPDWTIRRGWDTPEVLRKRPKFELKLSLMLDRNNPEFGEVLAAYQIRNECAHGQRATPVGSIGQLVQDLFRWEAVL